MKKTIQFTSDAWGDTGWSIDFSSSKIVPAQSSFGTTNVEMTSTFDPLEETSKGTYSGFEYEYSGSIALVRTGTSTWTGTNYRSSFTETMDVANTKIKKISTDPWSFDPGFSITFAGSVAYDSIAGKRIGALIEDGDTIVGTGLKDSLKLTAKIEIVRAGGGNDLVDGRGGNDQLFGENGNDTLVGGVGADRLDGGAGVDTASYAGATKGVTANLSNAAANTNDAKGDIYVSIENLTGSSFADRLTGNNGVNVLKGGIGNDTIYGAKGADDLYGGGGNDVFVFKALSDSTVSTSGRDTIFDFNGNGDRIDLSAIDANTKSAGNQAFNFIGTKAFSGKAGELQYVKKTSDTYIQGDVNGDKKPDFTIHLDDRLTLDKGDFVL